jgi:hypothetical protein
MERPGQFIYHEEHEVHEGLCFLRGLRPFVVESDFSETYRPKRFSDYPKYSKKSSTLSLNFEKFSDLFFFGEGAYESF